MATVSDFGVATGEGGKLIRIDELGMFREFPHAVRATYGELRELMIAIVWEFRDRERIILVSRRQAAPKAVMGLWAACRRLRSKEIKKRRKS